MNMKRTTDYEKEITDEFDNFLKNESDPIAVAIKKYGIKEISLEDKEFLLDQARTADSDVFRATLWVKDTCSTAKNFQLSKITDPIRGFYFFIQLFELLKEGTKYFSNQARAANKVKSFILNRKI